MAVFSPQVAVITGASSGVGRAMARALATEGTALCLVGRDRDRLDAVAVSARGAGSRVHCYPVDLSRDEDVEALGRRLQRDCPAVDVLIHSAGAITLGSIEEASVAEFDHQYRVNVRAPYLLTQRLLPILRTQQGQIVFINSTAGLIARAGVGQYAATKHALKAIADSIRDEVNREGVRVLTVFLGQTATPMQAALHHAEGRTYEPERLVQPEDVASVVLSVLGLPRTAEVTELTIRPAKKPTASVRS